MAPELRVLLADQLGILRAGLRTLLENEPGIRIVGEASSAENAVAQARVMRPNIVLMELDMPRIGGLEATRRVVDYDRQTHVLVMTMDVADDYLLSALEAGAEGYLWKTTAEEHLVPAIRTVARGGVFLYPSAATVLLQSYRTKHSAGPDNPLRCLTRRERDVLAMTANGFNSREIGEKLFISPKTVDTYRARVMTKLKLHHRSELVRVALETRLLKL